MNTWEAITGLIVFVIGLALFWQSYNYTTQCNSWAGQISTALTSLFGGTAAQACYNSVIVEVASILAAIIGLVIVWASFRKSGARR